MAPAGVRLRAAMGSACAWDPDGHSVACSFSDGSIVITVRPSRTFLCPLHHAENRTTAGDVWWHVVSSENIMTLSFA